MTNLDYVINLIKERSEQKFSTSCELCKIMNPNYCILNEFCPKALEIYEWLKKEHKEKE